MGLNVLCQKAADIFHFGKERASSLSFHPLMFFCQSWCQNIIFISETVIWYVLSLCVGFYCMGLVDGFLKYLNLNNLNTGLDQFPALAMQF